MNKLLLSLSLLLGSVAFGAAEVVDPIIEPKACRFVDAKWCALGTSITWYDANVGFAGGKFTKGYQTRVLEQIRFADYVNKGISGGCVSSAIGQVEPADFYTVEHGVNDWGNRIVPGTIDDYVNDTGNNTFAANYRKVINNIRKANPKAPIIICTPRKGYGFGAYLPDNCEKQQPGGYFLKDYVDVVRAIAAKEKFVLCDFYTTCGEQDELADLSIDVALHPNDAGYQRMANELVKAMLKVYPKAIELSKIKKSYTDDGKAKSITFENFLSGSEQVMLKGVELSRVTVSGAEMGGLHVPGGPFPCTPFFAKFDAEKGVLTCQIQQHSPQDKCLRVVGLELKEDFRGDVRGRVAWVKYLLNAASDGLDMNDAQNVTGTWQLVGSYDANGYAVKNLKFEIAGRSGKSSAKKAMPEPQKVKKSTHAKKVGTKREKKAR